MDNEFKLDEYEFSTDTQTAEPEAVEAVEEAPVSVAAAPAEKKKSNFKFSPKMLIAPGTVIVISIVTGVFSTIVNAIASAIATGASAYWVASLFSGITNSVTALIWIAAVGAVGYFVYKNISKALRFMAGIFAAQAAAQGLWSVGYFIFTIIMQICYNNYNYEAYAFLSSISAIIGGIFIVVVSAALAFVFVYLIEKAGAKKAEEAKKEVSKADEAIDEIVEEIYEETVEEAIEEIVEEVSEEKAEKIKKKALSIDKKATILMVVSVILCALPRLPFFIVNIVGYQMHWYHQWQFVLAGLLSMITSLALVAVSAIAGFVATKKIDGAIKFLGAHKTAIIIVSILSSALTGIIDAILSAIGTASIFYVIADIVVGIPVLIITAVLAVALINLFDMGINFKKKSKKAPVAEKVEEIKEEIAGEFEEPIEKFEEAAEEVVEVSYE